VKLNGKVALVTGGSRGLGKQMVVAFAECGAEVIIAGRKIADCEQLAGEIRERTGQKAVPIACNVSDWGQCDTLLDTAYAEFGRVDILVNNAGMSPLYPSLDQVEESLWDKVVALNLKGPFRLAARAGTQMAKSGGGSIINISSVAAIRPAPENLPYAAAKAGLNALTEGFAQAFGPTVRVNTIQCGAFSTDVSRAWTPLVTEALAAGTALGRVAEPAEIVGAALYFASEASSFCTGSTLRVDGGVR
jgi:NAD(P)-dependent dehydrogenase (short-subunit alcohol dehydrogenase family)